MKTPILWKHAEDDGVYKGSAVIAVSFDRAVLPTQISRITSVIGASDWAPMVHSGSNRDLPGNRAAYILEIRSESDSIHFLRARMEISISALLEQLESIYPNCAINAEDESQALGILVSGMSPTTREGAKAILGNMSFRIPLKPSFST